MKTSITRFVFITCCLLFIPIYSFSQNIATEEFGISIEEYNEMLKHKNVQPNIKKTYTLKKDSRDSIKIDNVISKKNNCKGIIHWNIVPTIPMNSFEYEKEECDENN